jgi:LPXTG-motif cell wall-anchored protein
MSSPLTRILAAAGITLLIGGLVLTDSAPADAVPPPVALSLEIAGPDGVFVPVASGAQFAVSSTTATTARWTITNPSAVSHTGYYLYTYGPDCLVSDVTIAALGEYVCSELIAPQMAAGIVNAGALAGLYEGGNDYPVTFPLIIDIVDDTNGQSLSLSETTVAAEGTLVISGTGFDEDDLLTGILTSTPVNLGAFTVTGGAFSYMLTLPAGFAPGTHTITLYSNGIAYGARTFVLLAAPTAALLPATGADATAPALLGGSLLALGLVLVLRRRAGHSAR